MNPLTIGFMAAGMAGQIYGGIKQSKIAGEQAQVSEDVAQQEQGINAQKMQQMTLQAGRTQLENFRNVQKARAQGLTSATNQGAQFGSGLQGGQAQATDQGLYNALGINQNLAIGQNIAGLNDKISQDKMMMASLGGSSATAAGIASLGGAMVQMGPTIGNISKGFGNVGNNLFGGGSPSGYGQA